MDPDPPWIARLRTLATALDESVPIPGTGVKIGLDPLLGLLPVAGDVAASVLSLVIVAVSARRGVRKRTLVRMLGNIAVDVVVGSVPVFGDLFDVYWKANVRNVELAAADVERRS